MNQYTGFGGSAPPTYDRNGNLTFDGSTTYTYDAENRLLSMTQPTRPSVPTQVLFPYSPRLNKGKAPPKRG